MSQPNTQKKHQLENTISLVLISGVILSFVLEISGITLYYIHKGNLEISSAGVFIQGSNFFSFLFDELTLRHTGDISIVLMSLGLAVLMLTPFVRVLLSIFFFNLQRDYKYLAITLFVLLLLTISLILH